MSHIDVSAVLRHAGAQHYTDLVTRPTGAAVREWIEAHCDSLPASSVVVMDFSHVGLLDFSCADEVIAKLLLRYAQEQPPEGGYFLFRGITEMHLDAIETVLERHGLALVTQSDEGSQLVGTVADGERRAWEVVSRLGHAAALDLARETGCTLIDADAVLEALRRRRLVLRIEQGYIPVGPLA